MDGANETHYDFIDLRTRAELLDICGDSEGARRLRKLSLEIAREVDLTCYAYQLIWRNKIDDAIDLLEHNANTHPDSWNVRHSLGEAFEALGDYYTAAINYRLALTMTTDEETITRIGESLLRAERRGMAAS
jgi:tetratricopeptide (TPR) repeat protein